MSFSLSNEASVDYGRRPGDVGAVVGAYADLLFATQRPAAATQFTEASGVPA
jgi:hypothetical protein